MEHGSEVEMEFIVAGGDAAEGFESGEEVFDTVTFVIQMLVKGRFLAPVGMYGYDGGAALLVHISTEGIAVVAFVHDDRGAGPHMGAHQRFGLVDVGDVGASQDKSQRITQGVAGHVDLGRYAGPGPAHRLRQRASGRTRSMRVNTHRRAVDQHMLAVGLLSQRLMDRTPQTASRQQPETAVDTLPWTEKHRQIPPPRSGTQHPQDAFDPQSQIPTAAAATLRPAQALPPGLNFFSPSQCASPRTNLGCWFTSR